MSFESEGDADRFGGTYRASCHYAELGAWCAPNIELGDDASFANAAAVLVRQASEVSRAAGSEAPPSRSRFMLRGIAEGAGIADGADPRSPCSSESTSFVESEHSLSSRSPSSLPSSSSSESDSSDDEAREAPPRRRVDRSAPRPLARRAPAPFRPPPRSLIAEQQPRSAAFAAAPRARVLCAQARPLPPTARAGTWGGVSPSAAPRPPRAKTTEKDQDSEAANSKSDKECDNSAESSEDDDDEDEEEEDEDDEDDEASDLEQRHYNGVYWDKGRNKWKAQIAIDKRLEALGRFDLKSDAARAYDRRAREFLRVSSRPFDPRVTRTVGPPRARRRARSSSQFPSEG